MDENLVVIKTYTYPSECLIDKAKLESEGIPCLLKDENIVMVQPFYSNAIGGVKLMVSAENAELALSILANQQSDKQFPEEYTLTPEETQNETKYNETQAEEKQLFSKWGCFIVLIIVVLMVTYLFSDKFIRF